MASDHTLAMRRAVVQILRADVPVTSLLANGAASVYGPQVVDNAAFPFIRYGLPITTQYEATQRDGSEHAITIHCFANGPGEDTCANISAAVSKALDGAELLIDFLGNYGIDWTGTQIIRDTAEADAYHGIVTFTARTYTPLS